MTLTPRKRTLIPEKIPEDEVQARTQAGRKRRETGGDSAAEEATDGRMRSQR